MRTLTLTMLALALVLSACGSSAPPEAHDSLKKASAALKAKDKNAFVAQILPAQRTGALGLSDAMPITGVKASTLAAADVLDVEFFADATEMEVLTDGDSEVTETSATIMCMFSFGDGSFGARSFVMKKEGNAWFIDFKGTLERWHSMNGADAFSVIKAK